MDRPRWIPQLAWLWRTALGRSTLAVLACAVAITLAMLPVLVLEREFDRLEQTALRRDAARVAEGVQNELRTLSELNRDWGIWDDAYAFAAGQNPAFVKANLGWGSLLASTNVQLVYVLDPEGRILWGGFHPRTADQAVPLPAFSQERIRELPLLRNSGEDSSTGLILTEDGPLLLARQAIRPSDNQGPSRGTLIMGRLLDETRLQSISSLLALPFQARDTLRQPLDPAEAAAWAREGWQPRIRNESRARLDLLVAVPDMYGKAHLVFTLPWERVIHVQGQRAGYFVFSSLFAALLIVAGALLLVLLRQMRENRRYQDSLETAVAQRTSELREAERRFRAFVDHTNDLMFWCRLRDTDGAVVLDGANPAALRFMGLPLETALGRPVPECLPATFAEPLDRHIRACLERGVPLISEDVLEIQGLRMVFQTALVPARDEHGRIHLIAGSARDITALREREEALLHAQKLESLGVLAGGIAHDFNNILTAARINLDMSALLLPKDTKALGHIDNVHSALSKAANLTRQMLAYSGRGRFLLQIHDLNQAVQEMTALLEISISKKATLVCELSDGLPPLEADVAQIQQVIMNLVTNASDALQEQSGTIRVRTWAEMVQEPDIAQLPVQYMKPGPHVVLEVSDTGSGMPPEVQARIFEPFFSTKGVGRGLGLSAMLGILRSHRGGLALESVPGQGTTFRLWFPASELQGAGPATETVLPQSDVMPAATILLVEDDETIRHVTARLVRNMGFLVLEAEDGLAGLECFQQHQAEIRLIMLDLTMPRMDGRELLTELRKTAPALPVIVSSGYSEQELPLGDPALFFLQKPYQSSDLRTSIRRALDSVHVSAGD